MRHKLRSRLTYANLMATIAVFIALGGGTFAATGGNFILGQPNSASSTTSLSSGTTGPALKVTSTNTGTGATALGLNVASGHAPLTVNSGAKVTNLNADKLDGKHTSNWKVKQVIYAFGPLPVEGTYTSAGGRLLIMASGSGFRSSSNTQHEGFIAMRVRVDGLLWGDVLVYTNERQSHRAFVPNYIEVPGLAAGSHTIRLEAFYASDCNTGSETTATPCTATDSNDFFNVAVTEVPS